MSVKGNFFRYLDTNFDIRILRIGITHRSGIVSSNPNPASIVLAIHPGGLSVNSVRVDANV